MMSLQNEQKLEEFKSSVATPLEEFRTFPLDITVEGVSEKSAPASLIIDPDHLQLERVFPKERLLFCYRAILNAIESCASNTYTDFDGHTTANCCHGMALLARRLINAVNSLDLDTLRSEGESKIKALEMSDPSVKSVHCTWWLPKPVVNLACLYILAFVKESDPTHGGRTVCTKLSEISPISKKFSISLVKHLQKIFPNWIAYEYRNYLEELPEDMTINKIPVSLWGKYVEDKFIKKDKRGVKYTSNLFSMQVALAHLIKSRGIIALVNDVINSSGSLVNRMIWLFQGNGKGSFQRICSETLQKSDTISYNEPIIVFGGCVYSDDWNQEKYLFKIDPWINDLSKLVLACDVFYPQFCKVGDDPEFDSGNIRPDESTVHNIIDEFQQFEGVSATNPSIFCLAHIYPASKAQITRALDGIAEEALSVSFLPKSKTS